MSRPGLSLVLCFALLAGCGEQPDEPPPVFEVQAPRGSVTAEFPEAGISLEHPRNWTLQRPAAPGVFELVSGEAIVAGWAYPREEPLPDTEAELEAAKNRLLEAIEERDPGYELEFSELTEVAGAPAIEAVGQQVISRRRVRIRSVHVFEGDVEYVIEAITPPGDFELVDRRVLAPLLDSLELEGEVTGDLE